LLTTLKIIQLNNDKPPKIFRKALELSFFSRNARKRKIAVQLIQPLSSLGNKGDIVKVSPGYMRHRLYPNRVANYYIPRPRNRLSEDIPRTVRINEEPPSKESFSDMWISFLLKEASKDSSDQNTSSSSVSTQ
ncbi:3139_t:CDS:2, partial [Dentiscutata heterogama]